ncbi:sugar kinase [Sutcliffiella halmapala]|uniref:sugar kinase n=1 Tax=Sutcliffiella halmapala TaxID=79882 RepID=UPI00099578FE|nr:sugar kinase [Sutcliffiella halmapala]
MKKIITFGEIMMRLTPPNYDKIIQTTSYQATFGGGEANVAVSLALFGHDVEFVTKLPTNELGKGATRFLQKQGVATNFLARGGERLGIYFLEQGMSVRPSQVIYDRKDSSIALADHVDFDWDNIFEDAVLFHTSGISEKARQLTLTAMREAKSRGITTSFDMNYRSKLWGLEEAQEAMKSILPYVDICFGGYLDAVNILGIKSKVQNGELTAIYSDLFSQLALQYGVKQIVCTNREIHSVTHHTLTGYLYSNETKLISTSAHSFDILDRVGGGDAFAAGFLHGFLSGWSEMDSLNFALGASVLKHTISGDSNAVTVEEVQAYLVEKGKSAIAR